mgnify:CR=1 FL=1
MKIQARYDKKIQNSVLQKKRSCVIICVGITHTSSYACRAVFAVISWDEDGGKTRRIYYVSYFDETVA